MNDKLQQMKDWSLDHIAILAPTILIVLVLSGLIGLRYGLGLFPFGPEHKITAKVNRLYVDYSGSKDSSSSHYMVGTDKGVFEVSNSIWLWIWDADKRYSQLQTEKEFILTIKGNELVNFLFQEYPIITSVFPKENR